MRTVTKQNYVHSTYSSRYNLVKIIQGRVTCEYTELLLVLPWATKLELGSRSSACGKELLDGNSSSRSWSELSSTKFKESSMCKPPLRGNANRLFGLMLEPSTASLPPVPAFTITLLGLLIVVFNSEICKMDDSLVKLWKALVNNW